MDGFKGIDRAAGPKTIRLFRATALVPGSQRFANKIEQLRRPFGIIGFSRRDVCEHPPQQRQWLSFRFERRQLKRRDFIATDQATFYVAIPYKQRSERFSEPDFAIEICY
jgi:hypothetical protein